MFGVNFITESGFSKVKIIFYQLAHIQVTPAFCNLTIRQVSTVDYVNKIWYTFLQSCHRPFNISKTYKNKMDLVCQHFENMAETGI